MMSSSKFIQQCGMSYSCLHERIRKQLLLLVPLQCTKCGSTINIELANIKNHVYTENVRDYTFLCSRCHIAFDNRYINLKQGSDAIYQKSTFYNPNMTEKECTRCHIVKPLSAFGNRSHCRECDNRIHKDRLRAKGTSWILKLRNDVSRGVRTCKICNTEKLLSDFVKNGSTTRTVCKPCYREIQNTRYQNSRRCY